MLVRGGSLNDKILIDTYLSHIRRFIDEKNYFMEKEDKKNLSSMGIAYSDAIRMCKNLTHENYVNGPIEDYLFPKQSVFVFGQTMDEIEIYIKLTIKEEKGLFIMSFHEAKYPMEYPYRKNNQKEKIK